MIGNLHTNITLLNYHEMYREHRIDDFNGSDSAYIHYLENQLEESRRHVSQLCQSLPPLHHPASPPETVVGLLDGPPNDGSERTS
jgi:hypothetical protein